MPALDIFLWGSAGGAAVAIFLYVLPEFIRDLTTLQSYVTMRKVGIMLVVVILLAAIAGLVTLAPPGTMTRGRAIGTGLGVQATLRGFVGAIQQAVKPVAATD